MGDPAAVSAAGPHGMAPAVCPGDAGAHRPTGGGIPAGMDAIGVGAGLLAPVTGGTRAAPAPGQWPLSGAGVPDIPTAAPGPVPLEDADLVAAPARVVDTPARDHLLVINGSKREWHDDDGDMDFSRDLFFFFFFLILLYLSFSTKVTNI